MAGRCSRSRSGSRCAVRRSRTPGQITYFGPNGRAVYGAAYKSTSSGSSVYRWNRGLPAHGSLLLADKKRTTRPGSKQLPGVSPRVGLFGGRRSSREQVAIAAAPGQRQASSNYPVGAGGTGGIRTEVIDPSERVSVTVTAPSPPPS